jgi:hypothetical protein
MTSPGHDQHHDEPALAVLELHDDPDVPTVLDGTWFPRTRDASAELTELIEALDDRGTRVNLIMLNPDGWEQRPRRVDRSDRSVRIAWLDVLDSAVLIATDGFRRLQLLVVVDDHVALQGGAPF